MYNITDETNNYRYANGFKTLQQAVWYLVSRTSKREREDTIYTVWHLFDDKNGKKAVITDWKSH